MFEIICITWQYGITQQTFEHIVLCVHHLYTGEGENLLDIDELIIVLSYFVTQQQRSHKFHS